MDLTVYEISADTGGCAEETGTGNEVLVSLRVEVIILL
jgi:hypothetical protein